MKFNTANMFSISLFWICCNISIFGKTDAQEIISEDKFNHRITYATCFIQKQTRLNDFAPNTCRIIGIIENIDSSLHGVNSKDPCSKIPCRATVRVKSIIGYGFAFPKPLTMGEIISIKFVFTLKSTKDSKLNIKESFPGLNIGSSFIADIYGNVISGSDDRDSVAYNIYGYKVKQ